MLISCITIWLDDEATIKTKFSVIADERITITHRHLEQWSLPNLFSQTYLKLSNIFHKTVFLLVPVRKNPFLNRTNCYPCLSLGSPMKIEKGNLVDGVQVFLSSSNNLRVRNVATSLKLNLSGQYFDLDNSNSNIRQWFIVLTRLILLSKALFKKTTTNINIYGCIKI